MNGKNIILSLIAFVLASCLVSLIYIATHHQALCKLHELIFRCTGEWVSLEKKAHFKLHPEIHAATKQVSHETAQTSSTDFPVNQSKSSQLPTLQRARQAAAAYLKRVHAESRYHHYTLAQTSKGEPYYMLTFVDCQHPNIYQRVTVDQRLHVHPYDDVQMRPQIRHVQIDESEADVIARTAAQTYNHDLDRYRKKDHDASGWHYIFVQPTKHLEYKVSITPQGQAIVEPTI
ncbi:hypothetical protein [Staphylococcus argensis]|uniref:PepSY domain-containing protein n=1 Tax=Staphylococcus argensis TaxID=1607738 RepID=A0A2K4FDD7_9STAP|nr:hypothetical protein [Staphylococcus argensis]MCY6991326.1 hypothetical protein [Staphylococcus argensis]POA09370.1 hypothetical protein CD039_01010 [Staphylococcus argensis]